ncbi:MAG TPA: molybdopterin-binding protein [Vitreimonas sp.]|nr:molybdopterin-binding protein [Vitreimonas sp.]
MDGPILTAELLSIGSELTVGETRDTNAGELARSLTEQGARVLRIQAVPDDQDVVVRTFADAIGRAELVVSTGGLGPTPDDLTREAIAAVCEETPSVDPDLEHWLRGLWARRGLVFPELNLKQAWLIPSATAIPNANGTAPGWWVERPDRGVIVALPGPPREMRPMWDGWVLPRLRRRGLGRDIAVRTLRLHGIGESQAAERLGEALLRASNPQVATYARQDAVDVRISAVAADGRSAAELANRLEELVIQRLGAQVWARGEARWADVIEAALVERGWSIATSETGTGGALVSLLAGLNGLRRAVVLADADAASVEEEAVAVREAAGADIGVALRVGARGDDTDVRIAIATAGGLHVEDRVALLRGSQGYHRAALAAADVVLGYLRRKRTEPAD